MKGEKRNKLLHICPHFEPTVDWPNLPDNYFPKRKKLPVHRELGIPT